MRPADRLFQIVLALGRGKVVTAKTLAERFGVSERTIYRDIRDLAASGVPVEGEAGVGYCLRRGYQLPPMMFDDEELEALLFGVDVARTYGDPGLGAAAERILAKVDAVLPQRQRPKLDARRLMVPALQCAPATAEHLGPLRDAVARQARVFIDYRDGEGEGTERIVRPLALSYWGGDWLLGAWCELRTDFRNFRIDRIGILQVLSSRFETEAGRTLEDYIRAVQD